MTLDIHPGNNRIPSEFRCRQHTLVGRAQALVDLSVRNAGMGWPVDIARLTSRHEIDEFDHAKSIICVVKEEILGGWLTSTRGLIAAGVFSDFLEMAQHLWDEKYKDAAAVIAGSSLEAHLKRMCETAGIPLEVTNAKGDLVAKKADTLNADLVKSGVYDKTEQKQVTAWLGVRNDAAHGHYDKVISGVVGAMIHGIRMFIGRYPA